MLVSKMIQLEFASTEIRAIQAIDDIRKGTKAAGLNLFSRYNVQLQYPMPYAGDKVVVEIKIPEEIVSDFAVGNHLRGISAYLLKYCDGRYDRFVVGNRLLTYTELGQQKDAEEAELSMLVRLELISDFVQLLKRTDDEVAEKIKKIQNILKEA